MLRAPNLVCELCVFEALGLRMKNVHIIGRSLGNVTHLNLCNPSISSEQLKMQTLLFVY